MDSHRAPHRSRKIILTTLHNCAIYKPTYQHTFESINRGAVRLADDDLQDRALGSGAAVGEVLKIYAHDIAREKAIDIGLE